MELWSAAVNGRTKQADKICVADAACFRVRFTQFTATVKALRAGRL